MAKESYRFFNSTDGDPRLYAAADFAKYFHAFFQDGVLYGGDKLQVSAQGMEVLVNPGCAMLQGYFYELSPDDGGERFRLTVPAAGNLPRVDRVVLRLSLKAEERRIGLAVLGGTPASSPVAPPVTRGGDVHELSLARVSVPAGAAALTAEAVTDERGDATLCGWSAGYGQPPYQPPGDISALLYEYTLYPNLLDEARRRQVESSPGLLAQFQESRLGALESQTNGMNLRRRVFLARETFVAPRTGNYRVRCKGSGGSSNTNYAECMLASGGYAEALVPLTKGQSVSVTSGAAPSDARFGTFCAATAANQNTPGKGVTGDTLVDGSAARRVIFSPLEIQFAPGGLFGNDMVNLGAGNSAVLVRGTGYGHGLVSYVTNTGQGGAYSGGAAFVCVEWVE